LRRIHWNDWLNVAVSHNPLVSVVMPAYNSSAYVGAALESVRQQTFDSWEVIVVDDCSTDDTREVVSTIAQTDGRVRLLPLAHNHGAPAAPRNRGVAQAKGRYIALLDADDVWHPQKLELQVAAMTRTGARLSSAGLIDFTDGQLPDFTPVIDPKLRWVTFRQTLFNTKTPTSTILAERELFEAFPFNEDLRYKAREDLDCFLHMHEEIGRSIKVLHPLLGYRITGSQQISGSKTTMIRRHYYVLSNYRFASGRRMGAAAALFTTTHFGSALYHRALRGRM
jgi:teichuronic acid biosynthesis glycosyltransferase TuaG